MLHATAASPKRGEPQPTATRKYRHATSGGWFAKSIGQATIDRRRPAIRRGHAPLPILRSCRMASAKE
jgi:hypothetical protein